MQVALVGLVGENQTAINCQGVHTPHPITSNVGGGKAFRGYLRRCLSRAASSPLP